MPVRDPNVDGSELELSLQLHVLLGQIGRDGAVPWTAGLPFVENSPEEPHRTPPIIAKFDAC